MGCGLTYTRATWTMVRWSVVARASADHRTVSALPDPLRRRGRVPALPPAAVDLHEDRDHRDQDDQHDRRQQVDVDLVRRDQLQDLLGQVVPGEQGAVGPDEATDQVPDEELPGGYAQHAGDRVQERPYDRDEPRQNDRLGRPEADEDPLGLVHVLLLEQPRVGPREQPGPVPVAEPVAQLGARDRADRRDDQEREDRQGRAGHELLADRRGGDPRQKEQRVAGEEEPHHQAGLREDDPPDADQPGAADQFGGVEQATQAGGEGPVLVGGVHRDRVPGDRQPVPVAARTFRSSPAASTSSRLASCRSSSYAFFPPRSPNSRLVSSR